MRENVLITGASGFLGYHIVNEALARGLNVFAAVRKNTDINHLKFFNLQYLFLDYENVADLTDQLEQHNIHYIIHAAGITKAMKQQAYNHINATYTLNLATAAKNIKTGFKKLVFISSLAATGPLKSVEGQISETAEPNPVTAYGRSKLLAEKHLEASGIKAVMLRPTAVYGPRDKDIFIVLKTIKKGFDPYIGKATQQLSFVHAADVATVAVNALFKEGASGVYNITDGRRYNRYEFADIAKTILKRNAFRFHIPMPMVKTLALFLETTNGWLKKPSVITREKLHELAAINWICDISKAQNELDFAPVYNLESGLEDSIAWYIKNKWI